MLQEGQASRSGGEAGAETRQPTPELPGMAALQAELEKHSCVTLPLLDLLMCRSIPGALTHSQAV